MNIKKIIFFFCCTISLIALSSEKRLKPNQETPIYKSASSNLPPELHRNITDYFIDDLKKALFIGAITTIEDMHRKNVDGLGIKPLAISQDKLLIGYKDKIELLKQSKRGMPLRIATVPHGDFTTQLTFSPDGTQWAFYCQKSKTAALFNALGQRLCTIAGSLEGPITFFNDNSFAYYCNNGIRYHKTSDDLELRPCSNMIQVITNSQNEEKLILRFDSKAALSDKIIAFQEKKDGDIIFFNRLSKERSVFSQSNSPLLAMEFLCNGKLFVAVYQNEIVTWDVDQKRKLTDGKPYFPAPYTAAAFNHDKSLLVVNAKESFTTYNLPSEDELLTVLKSFGKTVTLEEVDFMASLIACYHQRKLLSKHRNPIVFNSEQTELLTTLTHRVPKVALLLGRLTRTLCGQNHRHTLGF